MSLLRCPICHSELSSDGSALKCRGCGKSFPIVDGVPVMINEAASVFSIADFVERRDTFFKRIPRWKKTISRALPSISLNLHARRNYRALGNLLLEMVPKPKLLVLGGSIAGEGMSELLARGSIEIIETDVAWGPRTRLIADAHDIPYPNATFDGVIAQAVLEHVVDPRRCVDEIHRVLKTRGLVYAETPFMQQVHGGAYDFHRFTHLGHLRLFRQFTEINSGILCGPGMALAWAYTYFLMSFARTPRTRSAMRMLGRMTSFFLKYIDRYLADRPGALDAASAVFLLARKSSVAISDRQLLAQYRGAMK